MLPVINTLMSVAPKGKRGRERTSPQALRCDETKTWSYPSIGFPSDPPKSAPVTFRPMCAAAHEEQGEASAPNRQNVQSRYDRTHPEESERFRRPLRVQGPGWDSRTLAGKGSSANFGRIPASE